MKYSNYFAITILCALTSGASADSEAPPTPKVFASPSNSFYFKLIPSPDFDEGKSQGFLYRVTDGEDELLYRSDGWFSFDVLISVDGSYLARRGPWPRYDSPPETTPAVVFYVDGALVRTYYVSDLVNKKSALQRSISHYSWGGVLRWADDEGADILQVRTVEDKMIKFNIRTAEIVN
jgi:hypothetical protein